eukprot:2540242-Pleurochrysis_carterae.AAC.2
MVEPGVTELGRIPIRNSNTAMRYPIARPKYVATALMPCCLHRCSRSRKLGTFAPCMRGLVRQIVMHRTSLN